MTTIGLENFLASPPESLTGKRLGLLCNQASTDRQFIHSRERINQRFPGQLSCLLSPQHGFFSEKQDNMIESDHGEDSFLKIPLFSLYGNERRPTGEMFDAFDVLLVDLVDVGTRVYTFSWTLFYCLEAAAEQNRKIIVLDRPNPIGGDMVEGNILQSDWTSFVGLFPIPMRHGLTLGELALFLNTEAEINADLSIIPMKGWKRSMCFQDTGLPWVFPSPNMPSPATAHVYPGQVLWEGTNISEGRGTTLPFELFGAPFLNTGEVLDRLPQYVLEGCVLRPVVFEPTSNKWQGHACNGFQMHVTDWRLFRPYRTALSLLQVFLQLYPDQFAYKNPPYEYEFHRMPIDLILGDEDIRKGIEQGDDILDLEAQWQEDLQLFEKDRKGFFLYS